MRLPRIPPTKGKLPPETYDFMVDTRNCLQALTPVQSLNVLTSFTAKGVSREGVPKSRASEGGIELMTITAVNADTIICDSSTVARPDYLRASGGSYTYPDLNTRRSTFTQNSVSVTIDELITPLYAIGDKILVAEVDTDLVGVGFEDVNADGRIWLLPKRIVKICVLEGASMVTRTMVTYGSTPQ